MTPRIALCIPSKDTWEAPFGQSVLSCVSHTIRFAPEGTEIIVLQIRGTDINAARTRLARNALEAGATHLMWFDDDMTFPADTILRLLKHDKGIVAANYSKKSAPIEPTAKRPDGTYVYTDHMSTGLEPSGAAGFGVMLTKADVFARMSQPWFNGGDTEDGKGIGEDYYFCYRALAELDEPTWIDHDLSKLVGHVGIHVYSFEDALEDRVQTRLIKQGVLDAPDADLPHVRYRSIAGMLPTDPDALAAAQENYGRHWREREDAEEAMIRRTLEAR